MSERITDAGRLDLILSVTRRLMGETDVTRLLLLIANATTELVDWEPVLTRAGVRRRSASIFLPPGPRLQMPPPPPTRPPAGENVGSSFTASSWVRRLAVPVCTS